MSFEKERERERCNYRKIAGHLHVIKKMEFTRSKHFFFPGIAENAAVRRRGHKKLLYVFRKPQTSKAIVANDWCWWQTLKKRSCPHCLLKRPHRNEWCCHNCIQWSLLLKTAIPGHLVNHPPSIRIAKPSTKFRTLLHQRWSFHVGIRWNIAEADSRASLFMFGLLWLWLNASMRVMEENDLDHWSAVLLVILCWYWCVDGALYESLKPVPTGGCICDLIWKYHWYQVNKGLTWSSQSNPS